MPVIKVEGPSILREETRLGGKVGEKYLADMGPDGMFFGFILLLFNSLKNCDDVCLLLGNLYPFYCEERSL